MDKRLSRILLAGMLIALLGLAACAPAPEGGMGASDEVWGYVASANNAQLEIDPDQRGADELVVERVVSPGPAWVVVHLDDNGAPGERVGLAAIPKGESTNVAVELEDVTTDNVIVAIHADRGTAGEFDFDMMNPKMSPDRPYFVDGKELAEVVTVR